MPKNTLRIIGGTLRGRKIHFLPHPDLRPTTDPIRETLFNWLAKEIRGSHCLDLFAGSGALGFEALSRGAAHVTLIEYNRKIAEYLNKEVSRLGLSNFDIIASDAFLFLKKTALQFDIVFLDPPFQQNLLLPIIQALKPILVPSGKVYIESAAPLTPEILPLNWVSLKSKKAGQVYYALYEVL